MQIDANMYHGAWLLSHKAHSLSFEREGQAPSLYYPLGGRFAFDPRESDFSFAEY
jgi:hypothetical protein